MSLHVRTSQRAYFVPSRSPQHRHAVVSLYRALLRRVSDIELPADLRSLPVKNPAREVVRRQFRRNYGIESKRLVFSAIADGYKFLSLLHRARNHPPTHASLVQHLRKHSSAQYFRRPPALNPALPPKRPNPPIKLLHAATPTSPPVYTRARPPTPSSQLKSRRRIPVLAVTSSSIPFLRFGKPQPESLSKQIVIESRRVAKLHPLINALHNEISEQAEQEEEWERILRRDHGIEEDDGEPVRHSNGKLLGPYMKEVISSIARVWIRKTAWVYDQIARAKAMTEYIEEEMRLRDEEDAMGLFRGGGGKASTEAEKQP